MGADIGDINNDGYPEIFTTDMLPAEDYRLKTTLGFYNIDQYRLKERNGFYRQFLQNTLQLNLKGNGFSDIAYYSGVSASDWSWGALMVDVDNDGLNDLFVCNGIYRDLTNQDFLEFDANQIRESMIATSKKDLASLVKKIPSIGVPNKLFHNTGKLKFQDKGSEWGFSKNSFSNGAAYADLDNDGDLDFVINNVNETATVYRNRCREQNNNNFLAIVLQGNGANTFAIGSKIFAYCGNEILTREIIPSRGFQSSVDYKQIIGTGTRQVDSLVIIWPDRRSSTVKQPALNKLLTFTQPRSGSVMNPKQFTDTKPLLASVASNFEKHEENDYTDFYFERITPRMLSAEGPKCAVGDVNGDSLEDVYIGGTAKNPGQLYFQSVEGKFFQSPQEAFQPFAGFEDAAILLFDCDNDKDLDLFLGAGGNEAVAGSRELQHRLFMNDGKGRFQLSSNSFPLNKDNTGAAAAYDFDSDGDLDLFVGARSVSMQYGLTPLSHVYTNNGRGIFSEMPARLIEGIHNAGMVTDAVWVNVDSGPGKELIIIGEWMAPRIFKYESQKFSEISHNLSQLSGWWQTVSAADLDNDGREDLVLGNTGENFYLQPSESGPVKLWINDFDGNGSIDKVMTRTVDRKDKPVFMKREIQEALPGLKKQNLRNTDYANKTINDLFAHGALEKAEKKVLNYFSSCIVFNEGNGKFKIKRLPPFTQFSSVNAVGCIDINSDGKKDIVLGGNEFNFQPQFGRLDANKGQLLLNNGNREFTLVGSDRSGLNLKEMVREIVAITGRQERYLLFLQCNAFPALFTIRN